MKSIVFLLLFALSLFSAEINWPSDYNKALQEAKIEHKLVYILITSDSCRWCRKFEHTTLQDKQIQKRLYSEFVTVHLSRDRNKIPKQFNTTPIPHHYFVDSKGKILYRSLGHRDVEMFNAFMDMAEENNKKNMK